MLKPAGEPRGKPKPEWSNLQRLTPQGKIEDILRRAPARHRDLWILALVGVANQPDTGTKGQLASLREHCRARTRITHWAQRRDRELMIEAAPVNNVAA